MPRVTPETVQQAGGQEWDQRQGEIAVGDGAADLAGGALHVDVNPLVVAGGVGELVHPVLIDLHPVGDADFLAHHGVHFIERDGFAHGGSSRKVLAMHTEPSSGRNLCGAVVNAVPWGVKFDERFLDEIKGRLRLSDVIGRSVKLRRSGREYVGLSPFGKEKSPVLLCQRREGLLPRLLLRQARRPDRLPAGDRAADVSRGGGAAGGGGWAGAARGGPAPSRGGAQTPGPA